MYDFTQLICQVCGEMEVSMYMTGLCAGIPLAPYKQPIQTCDCA